MKEMFIRKLSITACLLVSLVLLPGCGQHAWADKKLSQGVGWEPEQIIFLPWGKGQGQAGKIERQEGASEGPAGFALSQAGELYLLDKVNCRILKFNPAGAWVSQIPLPMSRPCWEGTTFEYIEVSPGGDIVLLDPTVEQVLVILDPTGKETARYKLADLGIPAHKHRQAVTEMFFAEDGLYLDYRKFFDNSLKIVKGNKYPGKPFKGKEQFLTYSIGFDKSEKAHRLTLMIDSPKTPENSKEKTLMFKGFEFITGHLFDSDQQKNIYFVYSYAKRIKKPDNISESGYIGIKFDEQFNQIAKFQFIPKKEIDLDYVNNVRVSPEGKLYLMIFSKEGVRIFRWP